ncbi:chemotaxis protein CheW [Aquisalimonas sp.]|uniref:chemotaxis protein CheW n=1 Tax=unclassified Aquisalimonas TaxID=2644645 RepID=UPI0025C044F3|nr:chemotaxis protein CheW [Aquisalimonas sp.]
MPRQNEKDESMPESDGAIRSLLLPLDDTYLLLPGTVVAEVVGYTTPQPAALDEPPEWLLGFVTWRGQQVPCVAFEALNGQTLGTPGTRARTVVLKALGARSGMPYIALRTRGIPRLINVEREGIEPLDEPDALGPAVREAVLAHGEPALIPDMDVLESRTHRLLVS